MHICKLNRWYTFIKKSYKNRKRRTLILLFVTSQYFIYRYLKEYA